MRNYRLLAIVVTVSMGAPGAFAADRESNQCPRQIAARQVAVVDLVGGWQSFGESGNHTLSGVTFSLGRPDGNVLLAPSKESVNGVFSTAEWDFPESDEDYWVSCEYARTTVVIAKSLGKNAQKCFAEYDVRFSSPVLKKWDCDVGNK